METNKKQANFFRFEDLRIYDKALEYNKWLVTILRAKTMSKAEEILTDDCLRTSTAIAKNIAEGSYHSRKDFEFYLKEAKANVRECYVLSELFMECNMFSMEEAEKSKEFLMELTRMLGALIVSLNKKSGAKKDAVSLDDEDNNIVANSDKTEDNYEFNLDF